MPVRRDDDVGRLDVAVHDARRMRGCQGARDLLAVSEGLGEREPIARDEPIERLSRHVLHHEKLDPGVAHDIVQRDDVRMIEGRRGARFLQEASLPIPIRQLVSEHFDRDGAVQPHVTGSIHFSHSPGAKQGFDFVRSQSSSRGEGHPTGG